MDREVYKEKTSVEKKDGKKLLIIKNSKYRIKCDSNIYEEFIMYDLTNHNTIEEQIIKAVSMAREEQILDVLFIEENSLYGEYLEVVYRVCKSKDLNVHIIPEYNIGMLRNYFWIENLYIRVDYEKPRLPQFQVHLTDVCNVKCKGCGHFCTFTEEPNMLKPEEYQKDLIDMKEKFWGVEKIYLLGGEPLLNKKIIEIIEITRTIFPDANIRVTTNGMLLSEMKDAFWDTLKKQYVHVEISLYKPTKKIWKDIQYLLIRKNVANDAYILVDKEMFRKQKVLKENGNYEKAFENCDSNKCYYLRDGAIYLCPSVYLNIIFYEHFGLPMPYKPEGFKLGDVSVSGWSIIEQLQHPNEACKYCTENGELFEWKSSSKDEAKLEDWVVDAI